MRLAQARVASWTFDRNDTETRSMFLIAIPNFPSINMQARCKATFPTVCLLAVHHS